MLSLYKKSTAPRALSLKISARKVRLFESFLLTPVVILSPGLAIADIEIAVPSANHEGRPFSR